MRISSTGSPPSGSHTSPTRVIPFPATVNVSGTRASVSLLVMWCLPPTVSTTTVERVLVSFYHACSETMRAARSSATVNTE